MRVAQVIGRLNAGGVEAVVNNYYRHADVGKLQFDYYIDEDSETAPSAEMQALGARYFVVPSTRHPIRRVRALTKLFREHRYPIVHAHMNTLNAPVLYAAWRAKVPVRIGHNHSTASAKEWTRNALKQLLRGTGGWFATVKMACGEAAGRWFFGNRAFDRGDVVVLPNAVDLSAYRFDPDFRRRFRDAAGVGGRPVVGHAGRFMTQKNHGFLLEIFAAVLKKRPDAALWLVGDGEERPRIEQKARELDIANHVTFWGVRGDLNKIYSAMDCLLLPSLYEGLPLVGVEAQAAGLPCFFADTISREVGILENARFIPLDAPPERWAQAIVEGMPVPDDQRISAAAAMKGGPFDLDASGRMLQDLYEKLCPRTESGIVP